MSTPSSTLSSKHIHLSKKRIQDYIRQLNQSGVKHTNDPDELTAKSQPNTLENMQNGTDTKNNGLLLQVIDNFVSCTIESINRRITHIRTLNESKVETARKGYEENETNSFNDKSYTCGMFEVIKNVRQFISGVKNYLIKTGEGDLHTIMQEERSKVSFTLISFLYACSAHFIVLYDYFSYH